MAAALRGTGAFRGPMLVRVLTVAINIVVAAILSGVSVSKKSDADQDPRKDQCYDNSGPHDWCDGVDRSLRDSALLGNTAIGLWIVGAAIGGATGLYALRILPPGSATKAAVVPVPLVSSSGGGLSIMGQF